MASLPPKPVSSPPPPAKDDEDRRRHFDERSSRHLSQDDRTYRPRHTDTYIATYDDDRYSDRRDRDRDRRVWDRGPRGREDDRDRRYDRRRDDTYIAYEDRRHRRPPSPRRPDRYRSRSPRTRRPYSPPRRPRHSRSPPPLRRPRSPRSPRPRTPERRRRNHSRDSVNDRHKDQGNARYPIAATSPPRRRVSRSRSHSRSTRKAPENGPLTAPNLNPAEETSSLEAPATQNGPSQSIFDRVTHPKDISSGIKPEQKPSPTVAQRSPRHPENNNEPLPSPKWGPQDADVRMRARSPSPPRQPRQMGNLSTRDGLLVRRASKSPPRGPRNIPKLSSAPGVTPPSHSSGLHGGRRPPPAMSSYSRTGHGPHETSTEPHAKKSNRAPITASLDAEIARLESHRANLAADYVQLAKNTKRALHELDMATLDLRAAEARRKVADSHLEKARAGTLGIPVDSLVS